jgi:ABC-type multidrug transport system fused ATPase/permease subunit
VDAQIVQSGTAEKVGLFIQSISYFVSTFIVGFILNARLTGILIAGVIPSMTLAVIMGTMLLNRFSKSASESTTAAASVAEGSIRTVQVVQAFDAFGPLIADHTNNLKEAMRYGVQKAISSAILLESVFFVAWVLSSFHELIPELICNTALPRMRLHSTREPKSLGAPHRMVAPELFMPLYSSFLMQPSL